MQPSSTSTSRRSKSQFWSLLVLAVVLVVPTPSTAFYSSQRKQELKHLAEDTWRHAYNSYKRVAFPADELLPLSCAKQGHDRLNPDNVGINDVCGDYALTLVDSLDTFAMLNDKAGFEQAVRETIQHVSFDVDARVQVFEVTIRMMGGLLSGHLLALDPSTVPATSDTSNFTSSIRGFSLPWYRSELLHLAHDLGRRLLPAFDTPTGIPFARVHLQKGLRGKDGRGESGETCSAGAGSLLLEFITLSRLTGSPIFETVARRAFFAIWDSRSPINLIGNTLDVRTGGWIHGVSSIGAGIDSFFEYAAKAYVLTGEDEYLRVWESSYESLRKYAKGQDGFWFRGVNMFSGQLSSVHVDSLSAFFPGVQVLLGDLEGAVKSHGVFAFLWKRFGGIPELFDTHRRQGAHLGYPLRPEFIESNMYLYQATKDEYYLSIAEQVLHDINNRTRVECGFAAVLDLASGRLEDKMPSFVTAETLKYLYLTFDETSPFLQDESPFVFTTEGHPLEIPQLPARKRLLKAIPTGDDKADPDLSPPQCAVHDPLEDETYQHYLSLSVDRRTDWEHARWLAGHEVYDEAREIEDGRWSETGFCEISQNEVRPIALRLSASTADSVPGSVKDLPIELLFASSASLEIVAPLASQLSQSLETQDVVVEKINGLRFSLAKSTGPNSHGYVVSKVGPYQIPPGRFVVVRDPAVLSTLNPPRAEKIKLDAAVSSSDMPPLALSPLDSHQPSALDAILDKIMHPLSPSSSEAIVSSEALAALARPDLEVSALAASFGPSLSSHRPPPGSFALKNPALPLATAPSPYGCEPHHPPPPSSRPSASGTDTAGAITPGTSDSLEGKLLLLHRGVCSFALKSNLAALSGARGVVIINSSDQEDVVPSASAEDETEETMRSLVPLVLVGNTTGGMLEDLVKNRKEGEQVWVRVREEDPDKDEPEDELVDGMVLGGYVVRNIKLGRLRKPKT
ncbi:hypothetical protein JCM10212_000077 [Sporobolomyces blumeae]